MEAAPQQPLPPPAEYYDDCPCHAPSADWLQRAAAAAAPSSQAQRAKKYTGAGEPSSAKFVEA